MKFRVCPKWAGFPRHNMRFGKHHHLFKPHHLLFTSSPRNFATTPASSSGRSSSSSSNNSEGIFLVPGATMATIVMLGILHARRLYDDKKVEEAREKRIEFEFSPDAKAAFLRLLPLRSISHFWGFLTSMEVPIWLHPYIFKAWARAFHSSINIVFLHLLLMYSLLIRGRLTTNMSIQNTDHDI